MASTKTKKRVESKEIVEAKALSETNTKEKAFKKLEEDYKALSTTYESLKKETELKKSKAQKDLNKLRNEKTVLLQELKNIKEETKNAKEYLANTQKSVDNAIEAGNNQIIDINHDYQRLQELHNAKRDELLQLTPELDEKYKQVAVLKNRISELSDQYNKENERYQIVLKGVQDKVKEEYAKYQDTVKNSIKIIESLKEKEREIEDLRAELLTKLSH